MVQNGNGKQRNGRTGLGTSLVFDDDKDEYPLIYTDEQPRTVLKSAIKLLAFANSPPSLFRRGGQLVLIQETDEGPRAVPVTSRLLYKRLVNLADWRKKDDGKNSAPPQAIISAILEEPSERFPELDSITAIPVLAKSDTIIAEPGYHASERLYFMRPNDKSSAKGCAFDLESAKDLLEESIQDFPFEDVSSRANALALMLLPFVRPAIGDSPTPLHLIESPTPGSGKGRLADLVSMIATGQPCQPTTLSSSKAENAKKFTSLLKAGAPFVLLDNLPQERTLNDPVLASFITTTRPTERGLGGNRMIPMKNTAVWIATANNPRCSLEVARRCVRIRIDPGCDRPWQRNDFLHPDLLGWAGRRRQDLIGACLAVVLHWVSEGRPQWNGMPLGSFERWSGVLGGILGAAGIDGFLENVNRLYERNDAETQEWRLLMKLRWEQNGQRPFKASELWEICTREELLDEVIGFGSHRSQVSKLGRALQQLEGRVFDGRKLVCDRSTKLSSARYYLKLESNVAIKSVETGS